jgi:hypothetical protein
MEIKLLKRIGYVHKTLNEYFKRQKLITLSFFIGIVDMNPNIRYNYLVMK